jgi:hypothetical protein
MGAPAVVAGAPMAHAMNEQAMDRNDKQEQARQKGVRRTLWITATIAVAIFVLSIVGMLKIG